MSIARYCAAFICIPFFFLASTALADTGKIQGKVTDQKNTPIPFANVILKGTRMGASTNANGVYIIMNIAANTYTVEASAVGYRKMSGSVTVAEGQTATQDFTLAEDALNMQEVVTTGTYTPRTKLESTVAISTLSPKEMTMADPRSTTEVLRYVPGFTRIESSGGEVNENISMRGILGVEYVMFMEDGMPVFPTMHTFFMNADNLFRVDENIERMEVVRGGNSALFGSNTPGAIINFINKTGGPDITGVMKATGGTAALARYDLDINGPLGDDWRFNTGGFYRYDRGVRYPGFPAIAGGQFKASITRLLTNGYVRASLKVIDDRNQFILDLPFQNPDKPVYVPGFSNYGSMNTEEGDHLRVPIPPGELEFPLNNGLLTKASWLTADAGFDFADNWSIQNTAQTMQDQQEWNAILPFDVKTAGDWFSSLGYPAGSTYQLFYTNLLDAKGNKLPFNMASNAGLGLVAPGGEWHVEKPLQAFQDQLQIKKSVGENKFSAGFYFANYTQTNRWYFSDILTNVEDNPHFLDLVVFTPADSAHPAGQTINATSNGFRHYLSNYVNGTGTTTIFSVVLGTELKLTEKLRADAGVRWESDDYVQSAENTSQVDLDGNPATTYDQEPWGNGSYRHFSKRIADWAASGGLNYQINDEYAVYAQVSRAYKMPALDEFLNAAAQAQINLFQSRQTVFYEGGVKYSSSIFAATLNGFYGTLKNNIGQGAIVDPATGNTVWIVQINPDSKTTGAEVDLSLRLLQGLNVLGAGTYTSSQTVEPAGASLTAGGIPKIVANVAATYTVEGFTVKGDYHYVAKRDIIDSQYDPVTKVYTRYKTVGNLPAYGYFNFGASYAFPGQGITIAADVVNAFQSTGLEEGNPRLIATGGNPMFLARPILPRRLVAYLTYQF